MIIFSILQTRKYVASTFKTMQSYLLFTSLGYLQHVTVGLLTRTQAFLNLERGRSGLGLQPIVLPLLTSGKRGRNFTLRMLTALGSMLNLWSAVASLYAIGFLSLNHASGLLFCRDDKECSKWRLGS